MERETYNTRLKSNPKDIPVGSLLRCKKHCRKNVTIRQNGEYGILVKTINKGKYISPIKNVTVAGRINVGMISGWDEKYDSTDIEQILYEKFYLGGSNTLRGLRPLRFFTHATDNVDNIFLSFLSTSMDSICN